MEFVKGSPRFLTVALRCVCSQSADCKNGVGLDRYVQLHQLVCPRLVEWIDCSCCGLGAADWYTKDGYIAILLDSVVARGFSHDPPKWSHGLELMFRKHTKASGALLFFLG